MNVLSLKETLFRATDSDSTPICTTAVWLHHKGQTKQTNKPTNQTNKQTNKLHTWSWPSNSVL